MAPIMSWQLCENCNRVAVSTSQVLQKCLAKCAKCRRRKQLLFIRALLTALVKWPASSSRETTARPTTCFVLAEFYLITRVRGAVLNLLPERLHLPSRALKRVWKQSCVLVILTRAAIGGIRATMCKPCI